MFYVYQALSLNFLVTLKSLTICFRFIWMIEFNLSTTYIMIKSFLLISRLSLALQLNV